MDPQIWSEIDATAPLTSNLSATALVVTREGEGLPNPTLYGGGVTLDFGVGAWTFTAGDLQVAARIPTSGTTLDVNVPLAAASYTWRLGSVIMADRSRIERLDGVPGDPWRYRNRASLVYPLTNLEPISALFATDEAFYDFGQTRWTRNRAQVGFEVTLTRQAAMQIYFMRQDDRVVVPSRLDILGATLRIDLR